jgi:peptidoglycan/LPS O-acetylase OafA/YrhL
VRERFDAGTGLVAVGAVLLLVSLFIDWYRPGGDAWAVFESIDLVLAGAAISALIAMAPRLGNGGLGRALPIISAAAFVVVAVQLIDPPPVVSDSELRTGAWLALAATAVMAAGSLLSAANISITVDVRGRERRKRAAAIDARDGAAEPAEEDASATTRRRFRRDESLLTPREEAATPAGSEDPDRTQTFDPVEPTNE